MNDVMQQFPYSSGMIIISFIFMACSDDSVEQLEPELRTEAVCDGGVGEYDLFVERDLSSIGPAGNDLVISGDQVWIVESGSNTISRFDRTEDQMEHGFIDVGNERNPYAIAVDMASAGEQVGEVWIANYASNTVTVAEGKTGEPIAEIDDVGFANPSAVALSKDYAFVANVDFRGLSQGYGPGSVSIIDRREHQVVTTVETAFDNPHFLAVEEIDDQEVLFVSGAGAIRMTNDGVIVESEGGLEWFDIGADYVETNFSNLETRSFPLGQATRKTVGAPGRPLMTPGGDKLYFVSAIAGVVFVFDLVAEEWIYNAKTPLQLFDAGGDATHRGSMGADGLLWVTAFNDDALYLIDTTCDELVAPPIDLGVVANMLEGPQAVMVTEHGAGFEGYYLLSIANSLGRLRLEPTGDNL